MPITCVLTLVLVTCTYTYTYTCKLCLQATCRREWLNHNVHTSMGAPSAIEALIVEANLVWKPVGNRYVAANRQKTRSRQGILDLHFGNQNIEICLFLCIPSYYVPAFVQMGWFVLDMVWDAKKLALDKFEAWELIRNSTHAYTCENHSCASPKQGGNKRPKLNYWYGILRTPNMVINLRFCT